MTLGLDVVLLGLVIAVMVGLVLRGERNEKNGNVEPDPFDEDFEDYKVKKDE